MNIEKIIRELTLEEKASLCSGQDFWHTQEIKRLSIPAIMMCDGPHGLRKQKDGADHLGINESIETVCYPTASALASSFDTELLERLGVALGQECQAENVGMLLGPGLNMKRSPLCGRNFEYFSEDPYLAGELGAAYIKGVQSQGIATCAKHFAANNQEAYRMTGSSQMDERTLHEIYLPAFETAVKKGNTRSVMCAYNAINGTFCAENKALLTEILRDNWGFNGMVVTDWGAVKDRPEGLRAGLDLEMPGGEGSLDADIVKAVLKGSLKEEILDQAVKNILQFVKDVCDNRDTNSRIHRGELSNLSGEIATECAVLLKNDYILPLNKKEKVAFIGPFAKTPRYQGAGSSHINVSHVVGAMEAAKDYNILYAEGCPAYETEIDDVMLNEALEVAKEADVAVIFAGLPDSFESEGADRETMEMPENQNLLIRQIAAIQPNTVVVLHGGSPMELPWFEDVKGVLCMYLGGERVGEASVKLLYGDVVPSGKLAESWPYKVSDNPSYLNFPGERGIVEYHEGIFIGYRYYDKKEMPVQFPFGYGLSYTEFTYNDLKLDRTSIDDSEVVDVTVKVRNDGAMAAKEVVQLYVSDMECSVRRPIRELKGFQKVLLAPGEEKEISFVLDKRAFAYYEPKIHDWFVETGDFLIEIGSSSRDIRLSACLTVEGTKELPMTYTMYSTMEDLRLCQKGRVFVEQFFSSEKVKGFIDGMKTDHANNMGEGSNKMAESLVREMSLAFTMVFGFLTKEQVENLLYELNS